MSLRRKTIHLAYNRPHLRRHLLPLITAASGRRYTQRYFRSYLKKYFSLWGKRVSWEMTLRWLMNLWQEKDEDYFDSPEEAREALRIYNGAYAIAYAMETGRFSWELENAIKSLSTSQLATLVADTAPKATTVNDAYTEIRKRLLKRIGETDTSVL